MRDIEPSRALAERPFGVGIADITSITFIIAADLV